ncbi:MAG: TRAP transporter large permease subunit [Proteobacteria bacterium]|nr:TRAP transporter large permease subunit [Pseudomonadota bacterium]
MDLNTLMFLTLLGMISAIILGVHIAIALGLTALIGTFIIFGSLDLATFMLGAAAYDALRDELFATIPLFVLMGDFVAKSGAARDLYKLVNRGLARIPGRLAVATVIGNAIFAAVTGVSIAAAAAFSRIAYPQMQRYGYRRTFALGSIAGSASLGMLIPPSILLIIWGIVTEISIGKLFIAGILPGLVLASLFIAYSIIAAIRDPSIAPSVPEGEEEEFELAEIISGFGILGLMALVLGGIWGGIFTSTEAAGIGALGAMVLGIVKGMRWRGISQAIIDAGRTAAPIMFLILTAAMYSRFLASGGIISVIQDTLTSVGFGAFGIYMVMVLIWLLLGMILDSASIILLTVPIFWPVAEALGFNDLAFAIFGILAIEAGLLTPPLGLLVYTVKGAIPEVSLGEIFRGSIPYWLLMLVAMSLVWIFPGLASWLPSL